jgi:hypothetical protein
VLEGNRRTSSLTNAGRRVKGRAAHRDRLPSSAA